MKTFSAPLGLLCLTCLFLCTYNPSQAKVAIGRQTSTTHGGIIAQFDFSTPNTWPAKAVAFSIPGKTASITEANVGTVDVAKSAQPSGGLLFSAKGLRGQKTTGFVSGKLPIHNGQANLKTLTLAFSLSASSTKPITVMVESFNATKKRVGGLAAKIYPAAPHFYQRYALDLPSMKAFGKGQFHATDPYVQISFAVQGAGEPAYQMQVDDIDYASAAYYVSPQGSDKNDGRTETTAFATPQKALDMAQPGDIVVLMTGTYTGGLNPVASFPRPGTPAAWIVLKNYPGQTPTLFSNGWNIVSITKGSNEKHSTGPALAYLEIRGLHVRGEGDVAKQKYPDAMDKPDSRTNSNGIAVDGRYSQAVFHDIRIADNLVEYCPALGLGTNETDWVYLENNITRYNSWTTIYGTSGISTLGASNFDGTVNTYRILVRNNISYGNETREICLKDKRLTDGNGIIIDVNQHTGPNPNGGFTGRTLVQNNLCFSNGGSGIHTVTANHVDIINNTAYLNSASPGLQYSEIFTYGSDDVRILNNILVAPVADLAAGEKPEPVKSATKSTNIVFSHNLYFGGNIAPTLGDGDIIADPLFMSPSRDLETANFHLKAGSPAIGAGIA